jgi:hypothetical protein
MKYDLSNNYKVELSDAYYAKLKDKKAWVEIKELKMKRNLDQNGLYWLWLTCIEQESGNDRHELHYLYRALNLQKPEEEITKIIREDVWLKIKKCIDGFKYFPGMNLVIDIISRSTTDLDESFEFPAYMDFIKKHARVNFNVILLNLDEKNFEDFYREYGFR